MELCSVIIIQGECSLKILCYSIQTFSTCLLLVEKCARHCGDILVNQILYLHMKESFLLVDLKVYTIMLSTGLERRNIIKTETTDTENKKMLEQLNLTGRNSI